MNLLAGHLLGDILFQSGWLAKFKTEHSVGMMLHCLLYSLGVWLFTMWGLEQILWVYITHYIIDNYGVGKKIYPKLVGMGNPKDRKAPCPMWLCLLCDQSFHIIVLATINKIY